MDDTHPFFARRRSRDQLIMLDMLAALCFAFVFLTGTVNATAMPSWMRIALPFGLALPLALRRLWPLTVFCLTLVLAVYAMLADGMAFAYLAPAYALYVVALSDRRGAVIPTAGIGVVSLVAVVGLLMAGTPRGQAPDWLLHIDQPLLGIGALGGAWTVGRAVQERRSFAARDADRLAAQAVAEERLRIARELHDVVTHSVGLIAVKAGVANHVMATKPEEAYNALRVIETASRSALVEMRHLLGVLRSTEVPDRAPTPGLAGIQELVRQARLAGVEVDLELGNGCGDGVGTGRVRATGGADGRWERLVDEVDDGREWLPGGVGERRVRLPGGADDGREWQPGGADDRQVRLPGGVDDRQVRLPGGADDRRERLPGGVDDGQERLPDAVNDGWERLPDGAGLSVYRIVQEALTNVVKHAAPARCRVVLVVDGGEVRIEVVDDGPGRRTLPSEGAGHGLIGMRERVMMYGGEFEAGSLPGRGFRVFARLPYQEVS